MAGRRRAWRAKGGDGALLEGSGWELTRAAETGELGEAEAARRGAMEVDGAEKSQARCAAEESCEGPWRWGEARLQNGSGCRVPAVGVDTMGARRRLAARLGDEEKQEERRR